MELLTCSVCHQPIKPTDFFCAQCGKKIKDPPVSTTVSKQIGIYATSVLLPPLGFWPGVHYLMQNDQKAKTIGLIAIILSIISTFASIWIGIGVMNSISKTINSQLNMPPGLGL